VSDCHSLCLQVIIGEVAEIGKHEPLSEVRLVFGGKGLKPVSCRRLWAAGLPC